MKTAYFDTFSGIAGDMVLGAFVGAGVPFEHLVAELRKLPLGGYTLRRRTVMRSMIAAVKIDVLIDGDDVDAHDHAHDEPTHQAGAGHEHHPGAHDGHAHDGHAADAHAHFEGEHAVHAHREQRSFPAIVDLIESSALSRRVKDDATAIFLTIAKAEAKIHGTDIDAVHFHEVGAVDSIVDIVGTAICLEHAGIERVLSRAVRTGGGGFVATQHGPMPIPAPATLEILKGYPVELTELPYELTTPTGAAVIATLSSGVLPDDGVIRVSAVGYGAGSRDLPDRPNLLRLIVGTLPADVAHERLVLLETNIDDMNPEIYPWLIERLMEHGAHDAYLVPILMKKGRPAQLLAVTCAEALTEELTALIWRETSTTGVRIHDLRRRKLPRDSRMIETTFGPVMMKEIRHGSETRLVPEYEECRRIARENGLPLIDVYKRLERESP